MELFPGNGNGLFRAGIRTRREEPETGVSESKKHQNASKWREIEALRHQKVGQLKVKYREVFGLESRSNHRQFLVRRIAWRLQANSEGALSERARQRAMSLAEDADLRIRAPHSFLKKLAEPGGKCWRDPRLPPPGSLLNRQFKGQDVSVEVLENGFRYQERVYRSLSAVARQVTGVQWNGFAFFGLTGLTERTLGK